MYAILLSYEEQEPGETRLISNFLNYAYRECRFGLDNIALFKKKQDAKDFWEVFKTSAYYKHLNKFAFNVTGELYELKPVRIRRLQ